MQVEFKILVSWARYNTTINTLKGLVCNIQNINKENYLA